MSDARFAGPGCLFFGIGAQKAATTWLHTYLAGHPEVSVPKVAKELHYWTTIRPPRSPWLLRRGRRAAVHRALGRFAISADTRRRALWQRALASDGRHGHAAYASLLFDETRPDARAVGEITPYYALAPAETFAEMAALSPNVRFLFVLRDPVERALSGLRMDVLRETGSVAPETLSAAIETALDSDPYQAIERSRYDLTLSRLVSAGLEEKVSVFFYETLFEQRELDRLTAALGVSPRPADVTHKVFEGAGRSVEISPVQRRRLSEALSPAYEAIGKRFGRLPEGWARP